jgi:transcriptional regulator with XRE-family HTH domain
MRDMPASTTTTDMQSNITAVTRVLMALEGGMTQTELAQRLDVDKATISKSFKGFRRWQVDDIEGLARVFDVPVATFFDRPEDVLRSRCSSADADPVYEQLSLTVAA